jgi:PIN domain nuclease of toxin-antitoxin system
VLDASALLAALQHEAGSEQVAAALMDEPTIGAVNLCEVVSKLADVGMEEQSIRAAIDGLGLNVVDFDSALAYAAGLLRVQTKQAGLSLGDRACLALAQGLDMEALTTDQRWAVLPLVVKVRLVR